MLGDKNKQELLIIRRGPAEDLAAAKGGAWKIAYADFVTAMMAFFLVMWLINSANEVTKARVASYFNPIKMTDAAPVKKGLREDVEPNSQKTNIDEKDVNGGGAAGEKTSDSPLQLSREKLMENPMAALEKIEKLSLAKADGGQAKNPVPTAGDPFDPKSESVTEQESGAQEGKGSETTGSKSAEPNSLDGIIAGPAEGREKFTPAAGVATPKTDGPKLEARLAPENGSEQQMASGKEDGPGLRAAPDASKAQGKAAEEAKKEALKMALAVQKAEEEAAAMSLQKEIRAQLSGLEGAIDVNVSVKVTGEGTLVVFEDGKKKSMFAVGSSSPNPALITLLGKVGDLINRRSEDVVIRGHTDGRRFRIETYDNWQLSTDRAHMASYMLMRGGLAESRLMKVEGYGSSQPALPDNVFADANRRVEILLARPES